MYDAETIEAINVEQLVTATDRLLIRGRAGKRRPSSPALGRDPYPRLVSHTATPVRAPAPRPVAHPPAPSLTPARDLYRQMIAASNLARGSSPCIAPPRAEPTLQMRAQPSSARTQIFAITVVIPTLVGIAVGLAALL